MKNLRSIKSLTWLEKSGVKVDENDNDKINNDTNSLILRISLSIDSLISATKILVEYDGVDDNSSCSSDFDRNCSSNMPKLICFLMLCNSMLRISSLSDLLASVAQIRVDYNEVDNSITFSMLKTSLSIDSLTSAA